MADILHRIRIAAKPDEVFALIATSEGIAHWWTDDSRCSASVGETSVFNFMDRKIVFSMKINEYLPGQTLGWTFLGDYDAWDGTTIRWDIAPADDGGSTLTLAHRGWPATQGEYMDCNTSWGHLLHLMKQHAEGTSVELPDSGKSGAIGST